MEQGKFFPKEYFEIECSDWPSARTIADKETEAGDAFASSMQVDAVSCRRSQAQLLQASLKCSTTTAR